MLLAPPIVGRGKTAARRRSHRARNGNQAFPVHTHRQTQTRIHAWCGERLEQRQFFGLTPAAERLAFLQQLPGRNHPLRLRDASRQGFRVRPARLPPCAQDCRGLSDSRIAWSASVCYGSRNVDRRRFFPGTLRRRAASGDRLGGPSLVPLRRVKESPRPDRGGERGRTRGSPIASGIRGRRRWLLRKRATGKRTADRGKASQVWLGSHRELQIRRASRLGFRVGHSRLARDWLEFSASRPARPDSFW